MANEELSGLIRQLGEIGTLIEQFSEIASEMKNAMNGAVSGLKKERADIEEAVKGITSASNKWESKIGSVSKDVTEISSKILSLNSSISNINKALDDKIQPVKDYSEACTSILDTLKRMTETIDRLTPVVESAVPTSDVMDRLAKIERAMAKQDQKTDYLTSLVSNTVDVLTDPDEDENISEPPEENKLDQ
ncbi:MAG: hypothetical protein ACI3U0_07925 [Oscillospiraceae bacterium]